MAGAHAQAGSPALVADTSLPTGMRELTVIGLAMSFLFAIMNAASAANPSPLGMHGFDFEYGQWRVHHKVKSASDGTWKEFDGTCTARPYMAGQGDIEEHVFS